MDFIELVVMAIWVFVVLVLPMLKKQQEKKRTKREYPEFPEENSSTDISAEERKLKEWLENVFGKQEETGWENEQANEDYEEEEEETYAPPPVIAPRPAFIEQQVVYNTAHKMEPAHTAMPEIAAKHNPWQGRIGKNQMAYGMIMAEVFSKPRALRPIERNAFSCSRKKTAAV